MTTHAVVLSPEALAQLDGLRRYIAEHGSPAIANGFVDRIVAQCHALADFPRRGSPRDDLRPGLRTIALERRVTIAYDVEDGVVTILAIAYAGRELGGMIS